VSVTVSLITLTILDSGGHSVTRHTHRTEDSAAQLISVIPCDAVAKVTRRPMPMAMICHLILNSN
jgi:ribosome maturation protein Sdo1